MAMERPANATDDVVAIVETLVTKLRTIRKNGGSVQLDERDAGVLFTFACSARQGTIGTPDEQKYSRFADKLANLLVRLNNLEWSDRLH